MAFESNFVTMIGNLTDDPELRFTPNGQAVCSFRIASNRRWTGKDGQQQEETTFISVNAWRDLGENVAESLHKGDRAIVIGRLKIRSYENQQNQTVWVTEIEADEIAPSLRWARVAVSRTNSNTGGGGGGGGNSGGGNSGGGGNRPSAPGGGGSAGSPGDFGGVPPPEDDVPF